MRIGQILQDFKDAGNKGEDLVIDGRDFAVHKIRILAQSGGGKTYTGSKIVEELLAEKVPVVVIDPVGHWWGLKEKFPIIIFGDTDNRHADYHLSDEKEKIEQQAELLATFVGTTEHSVIIDLKGWVDSKQQKFGAAFAKMLFRKNKHPRLVVVEEADIFIPQSVTYPDEINCRHYFDNLVRRGRGEGLGAMIITQRPALVSKNVLSQADLSIVLNLTDASDLEPAKKMIENDLALSQEVKKQILSRIMELPRGEALFYSTRWLRMRQFVKVYKKQAYHSGATRGEADYRAEEEIKFQAVDIDDVIAQLGKIGQAKSDVAAPAATKCNHGEEITRLNVELAKERAKPKTISEEEKQILVNQGYEKARSELTKYVDRIKETLSGSLTDKLNEIASIANEAGKDIILALNLEQPAPSPIIIDYSKADRPVLHKINTMPGSVADRAKEAENGGLGKCDRAILQFLAMKEGKSFNKTQIAVMTEYSETSSTYTGALAKLRSAGLITQGDQITIRQESLPTVIGLLDQDYRAPTAGSITDWLDKLGPAEKKIYGILVERPDKSYSKEELSEKSGYSITSSTFTGALSKLAILELLERVDGKMRLNRALLVTA